MRILYVKIFSHMKFMLLFFNLAIYFNMTYILTYFKEVRTTYINSSLCHKVSSHEISIYMNFSRTSFSRRFFHMKFLWKFPTWDLEKYIDVKIHVILAFMWISCEIFHMNFTWKFLNEILVNIFFMWRYLTTVTQSQAKYLQWH